MTRAERRKLGSRTRRRANTNGKVIYGTRTGSKKLPMRRNPNPVKKVK